MEKGCSRGSLEQEPRLIVQTKRVALLSIRYAQRLPKTDTGQVLGRQLLRAGTSVGANYRAACRAKSRRDMIAKLKIVEEETDEVLYWLELLKEIGVGFEAERRALEKEAETVLRKTVASIRTLRGKPD